jgi:hypothetical protein
MDVLQIPFHVHVKMARAADDTYIFCLAEEPHFLNHLGTIHACVQLALAEATAGQFLFEGFTQEAAHVVPMVRKTEVKYHKPANGLLQSKAAFVDLDRALFLAELDAKGRAMLQIKSEVYNAAGQKVLSAVFDWFIASNKS